jgi:large subunit ribosomal protein L22
MIDNILQSTATLRALRTSPRKLGIVASLIRGLSVSDALVQLTFNKRRIAFDVKKCLQSAVANADHNHAMNVDRLYVSKVEVGKSFVMKRFHARARGRGAKILKPFSNISITVSERE